MVFLSWQSCLVQGLEALLQTNSAVEICPGWRSEVGLKFSYENHTVFAAGLGKYALLY